MPRASQTTPNPLTTTAVALGRFRGSQSLSLLLLVPALLFPQAEPPRALPPSPLQLLVERTELAEPLEPGEPRRGLDITLFNPGPKTVHGFFVQSKELQYLFERRALNQRTWPLVETIIAEAMAAGGEPRTGLH